MESCETDNWQYKNRQTSKLSWYTSVAKVQIKDVQIGVL